MHNARIATVPDVQIRDVPDDVHRRLRAQAALGGQSLNELLAQRLRELADTPAIPETAARMRRRGLVDGPSSAGLIREDRDAR